VDGGGSSWGSRWGTPGVEPSQEGRSPRSLVCLREPSGRCRFPDATLQVTASASWSSATGTTGPPPTVSVLMPVRNGARWLDEAVASVLVQTWTDLELVVVDDASIDATPEMLGEWCERDSRVRIVRRDAATGAVAARRDAVAAARGPLLAMIDADDVAAPDRLRRQVAEMAARPALVLLGTGARYVDADGRVLLTELAAAGRDVGARLLHANLFFHPSVMLRADAFAVVGGYRSLLEPAEDYDLWLRLAEHGEVDNLADA
jgi:glycosyltransferase involved in cell wall biosynthesis